MPRIDPDYARMGAVARAGVLALCLGGGAALGFLGTLGHQSLPPVGVAIALITAGLYLAGLRAWGGVRTPATAGAVGLGVVVGGMATVTDGSVLVPGNGVGYAWLLGVAMIALVVLGWPRIQRAPRQATTSMEGGGAAAPASERFTEEKDPAQP